MADGTPAPRNEVFMYLDIVVEFQKRVVSSMDVMAERLHDQSAELTRITRRLMAAQENQIDFRSELGHRLDKIDVRLDQIDARLDQIDARFIEVHARLDKLEADSLARFEAVGARFEEIEKGLDQLARELREARSEIVAQNNQTINAVHAGLTVQIKLDEILERLTALEERLQGRSGTTPDH